MCKTHDLKTVLWTGTGNKCHVLQELVLSPLQQETCFMQNLQHATVPLTVVVSWALGQNSLGEKFHICKGGKNRNRSLAETYICVCVSLRVALSYKKRLWEFFQRLCIDEWLHSPWPIMVYLWILVCTCIHEDTTCPHIGINWHCRTTEKMGWPCYCGSRKTCSLLLPVIKPCLGDKAW